MSLDFIRLHNADTNSVLIVNVNQISLVDTDTASGRDGSERTAARVFMSVDSDVKDFKVNESPERIWEMINELKK